MQSRDDNCEFRLKAFALWPTVARRVKHAGDHAVAIAAAALSFPWPHLAIAVDAQESFPRIKAPQRSTAVHEQPARFGDAIPTLGTSASLSCFPEDLAASNLPHCATTLGDEWRVPVVGAFSRSVIQVLSQKQLGLAQDPGQRVIDFVPHTRNKL